jgi:polysaccharide pyruvyl transferase WcaK-like protein
VLVGTVSPVGLGDALQCYVGIRLLNNLLSEADITFVSPDLEEEISVFRDLKFNARLSSVGLTGANLLKSFLPSAISQKRELIDNKKTNKEIKIDTVNTVLENLLNLGKKIIYSPVFGNYIDRSIARSFFSFNAGIFGGHTISTNVYKFTSQYETLRSVVRGPILTFPISVSKLPFKLYGNKTWIRLKQSLQKLNFIYVRGPHSLEILRDNLNIDEDRVAMALDSGFGMRLINPDIIASKGSEKKALRIVIVPRKDYFYQYNRSNLYKYYLDAIIGLILWLSKNFEAEVYLTNQTVDYDPMGDRNAINDVVLLLKKRTRNSQCLKYLTIIESNSIIEAYRLYSSADLVVTSRMHGGVIALSSDTPVVFLMPSSDVKILDNLSFLGLDRKRFLIDMFDVNALKAENLVKKTENIIENLQYHRKIIKSAVTEKLPTIEQPVRHLAKLLG